MPYYMIKASIKLLITSLTIMLLVEIVVVRFEYWSVITTTNLFLILPFAVHQEHALQQIPVALLVVVGSTGTDA